MATAGASQATDDLQIFAFHNSTNETPAALKQQLLGTEGYDDVTYSPSGETWLVLSGLSRRTHLLRKILLQRRCDLGLRHRVPADEKPFYAPIIERIEDSFQAGRSD